MEPCILAGALPFLADGGGGAALPGAQCVGLAVHVGAWEQGLARGRVHRLRVAECRPFASLDQLLLEIEAALGRETLAAPDTVRSRWREANGWPAGTKAPRAGEPRRPNRKRDTFYIRILAQQHFTLQGTVQAVGGKGRTTAVPFRSGWELLCLLRSALEAGEETRRGKIYCNRRREP